VGAAVEPWSSQKSPRKSPGAVKRALERALFACVCRRGPGGKRSRKQPKEPYKRILLTTTPLLQGVGIGAEVDFVRGAPTEESMVEGGAAVSSQGLQVRMVGFVGGGEWSCWGSRGRIAGFVGRGAVELVLGGVEAGHGAG